MSASILPPAKPIDPFEALQLALPGVAKCQALSTEDLRTMATKAELRDLMTRLGLSKRGAAKTFGVDESTIRGWLSPRDLHRKPSEKALERARNLVEASALRERAAKLEAV